MNRARKVVASRGKVREFGVMHSRAAVSLCGKFLFEGECRNPESEKRKALVTQKDRVSGEIIGNLSNI